MQVERFTSFGKTISGKRERNTLVTYLEVANNSGKPELIRDVDEDTSVDSLKAQALRDGPMAYQLVGEVMAHQGYDEYRA